MIINSREDKGDIKVIKDSVLKTGKCPTTQTTTNHSKKEEKMNMMKPNKNIGKEEQDSWTEKGKENTEGAREAKWMKTF